METRAQPTQLAWQPFTPGGIAAFAHARTGRLFLVQCAVALLAAGTVVWFVQTAWCPVITSAIAQLPEQGEVRGGRLAWGGDAAQMLSENHFLALAVDLEHSGAVRSPAHVQIELGRADLKVYSLFGFTRLAYWRGWIVPCNRVELTPWWGAWQPPLLAIVALGTVVFLFLSWALLASVYCLPVSLLGFFANRDLPLSASWRLSGTALMPGAVLMTVALIVYRWGMLEVVGLTIVAAAHIFIGWCFLVAAIFSVRRHPSVELIQANPFTGANLSASAPAPPGDMARPEGQFGPAATKRKD